MSLLSGGAGVPYDRLGTGLISIHTCSSWYLLFFIKTLKSDNAIRNIRKGSEVTAIGEGGGGCVRGYPNYPMTDWAQV